MTEQLSLFSDEAVRLVPGKAVCIACKWMGPVEAPIQAAWVNCPVCCVKRAMFIYRERDPE